MTIAHYCRNFVWVENASTQNSTKRQDLQTTVIEPTSHLKRSERSTTSTGGGIQADLAFCKAHIAQDTKYDYNTERKRPKI